MSTSPSDPLEQLRALIARLPGVGPKSAYRMALHIVRCEDRYATALAGAIEQAKSSIRECELCCDFTTQVRCGTCSNPKRDNSTLCVVAHPQDRSSIERSKTFSGLYHVLQGVLDPLAGIGPSQLRIPRLLERLKDERISEVIVATSPTVEGDATALYLAKTLAPLGVKVTRIASGVAVGGDLEYADASTLARAFSARRLCE